MDSIVPQFEDLTEGRGLFNCAGTTEENVKAIKTEFSFAVAAPSQGGEYLEKYGFRHVSTMNNWWPTHAGQNRALKFFWRKDEKAPNLPKKPARISWQMGNYQDKAKRLALQLAHSGCGFKLCTPPVTMKDHYRFFTLMRLPIEPTDSQVKLLKKLNYRHLDTGRLASYWINGWEPKKYSFDREYDFFGINQNIWSSRGEGWYTYEAAQHRK